MQCKARLTYSCYKAAVNKTLTLAIATSFTATIISWERFLFLGKLLLFLPPSSPLPLSFPVPRLPLPSPSYPRPLEVGYAATHTSLPLSSLSSSSLSYILSPHPHFPVDVGP